MFRYALVIIFLSIAGSALDKVPFSKLEPLHPISVIRPDSALAEESAFFIKVIFDVDESGKVIDAKCTVGGKTLCDIATQELRGTEFKPVLKKGKPIAFVSEFEKVFPYEDPKTAKVINGSDGQPLLAILPSFVADKLLVENPEPLYPEEARMGRISGQVIIRIIVATDGKVRQAFLHRGHPMLADSALRAVRGRRYKPLTVHGSPIEFETLAVINFTLANS
jgi:TonB family protein